MNPLGRINVAQPLSVNEARRKVAGLVELLTGDPVLSTRAATATSELCRRLLEVGSAGYIDLTLDELADGRALGLRFHGFGDTDSWQALSGFFDSLSAQGSTVDRVVRGELSLPRRRVGGAAATLAKLRDLVERKERDELMAELRERNEELHRSLEDLRTTRSAKDRMESELNIGRDIQMSMLPLIFPPFPDRKEFSIFARLVPAREVGGDFYDFFFIDHTHLCVCVGDVSGKGVPSALFAAVTKTLIKSLAKTSSSPASVLTQANGELADNNESSMFVTILFAVLDVDTGELVFCNAGHNPPYIRRADGTVEPLNQRHGPVAGAMEGLAYKEDRVFLGQDDLLLLYTDGVTEACDLDDQLFSDPRLEAHLTADGCAWVEGAVDETLAAVREFENGAQQADDITLLAVQFFGEPEEGGRVTLEVVLKNELGEIARLQGEVEEFAEANDVPMKISMKLLIALDELINNIISYGYVGDSEHEIVFRAHVSATTLTVVIEDDGKPFNPLDLETPDTEADVEDRELGGLGIHIVKEIMDTVAYERRGERNVLTLTAQLPERDTNPED
jgi:sigma-B regulation protein RsbU (phosphoserine phosphatase)